MDDDKMKKLVLPIIGGVGLCGLSVYRIATAAPGANYFGLVGGLIGALIGLVIYIVWVLRQP